MGKYLRFVLLVTMCMAFFTTVSLARPRVGVFEFTGSGTYENLRNATNMLTKTLAELDRFDLVERAEIDRIFAEQRLQLSGIVDPGTATTVGKVLGVSYAFLGMTDKLEAHWENKSNTGQYAADARITVKIVEVETGKIVQVLNSSGHGQSPNRDAAISAALTSCFNEQLTTQIRQSFSLNSGIVQVNDNEVYFTLGKEAGVVVGARFQVLRPEQNALQITLSNDDSFTQVVGLVEVIASTNSTARAKVIWANRAINPGDMVHEVAQHYLKITGVTLQTQPYYVKSEAGTLLHGTTAAIGLQLGQERSFAYELGIDASLAVLPGDITLINSGGYGTKEFTVVPGLLYLTASGSVGVSLANQGYSGFYNNYLVASSGPATGLGFYAGAGGGLKIYFSPDKGARLELGVSGRLGPAISTWRADKNEKDTVDVTDYVKYRYVGSSGLMVKAGTSFAF